MYILRILFFETFLFLNVVFYKKDLCCELYIYLVYKKKKILQHTKMFRSFLKVPLGIGHASLYMEVP